MTNKHDLEVTPIPTGGFEVKWNRGDGHIFRVRDAKAVDRQDAIDRNADFLRRVGWRP